MHRAAKIAIRSVVCTAAILAGFGDTLCAALAAEGLAARAVAGVHPVLIRNEHNALLQVIVDVKNSEAARVTAMTFDLHGTTNLSELESLTLFYSGGKPEFSSTTPFGKPMPPAKTIEFHGDQPLAQGENSFWLACRLKPTADLSHRVAATCTSLVTNRETLEPRTTSPAAARHRIGVALRKHNDDGVHTYRIPALATTPKQTLLCVYDMRRRMRRDLQEDIDIGLSRSTDGGQTWEPNRVIMDMGEYNGLPQEQNGCSDPGIIVDPQTGEIFVFAVWMWGKPGKHQWKDDGSEPGFEIGKSAQMLLVRSRDDGLTWSKPENLTRQLKREAWWLFAPSPQQGIGLADGTLVMPAQGRDETGVPFACLLLSRDHGATWAVSAPAFSGGNECQAVELGDGTLMLNMRNDHERLRAVYVTNDLGQTWQPHPTNRNTLIEPNCNGSLRRIDYTEQGAAKHVLLFANPHTQKGRTHQTIQVSFDDGRTWPEQFHTLLDEGRGSGYPSLTQIGERHVGIVYEGSQADLVFEKFSIAELLEPH